jgi:hypothetical protein
MTLRARWLGAPPKVGDYLMSQTRPRFAYRVERVTRAFPNVGWAKKEQMEERLLQLDVDRIDASAVPEHARIHPWKWDKREAKHALARRDA